MDTIVSSEIAQRVLFIIIGTLGVVETLKSMIPAMPRLLKPFLTAGVSVGLAFLFSMNNWSFGWVEIAVLAWSLTQVSYDLVLKTLINLIDRIDGKDDVKSS